MCTKLYTWEEPKLDDEDLYKATIPLPPEMEPIVRETKTYKAIQRTIQKRKLSLTEEQLKVLHSAAVNPTIKRTEMVGECVRYLETLLRPVKADYKVWLYRAANWSMMPTENLYRVLVKYGITHDTSVYKGGCQGGNVCYDYRNAYDNLFAYPASAIDINQYDVDGQIIELPIYTEMRPFWDFVSPMRVFRMVRAKFHKHKHSEVKTSVSAVADKNDNRKLSLKSFFRLSPLKMDFNQVNSRGLKRMMKNIMRRSAGKDHVDVILIGHAKTFVPYNERTLEPFLKWWKMLS